MGAPPDLQAVGDVAPPEGRGPVGRSNADHAHSGPVLRKVRDRCGGKDGLAAAVSAAAGRTQIHLAGGQSKVGRLVSKPVFRGQQDGGSLMEHV